MTTAEAVKPLHYELGRHETFTLRENWLPKGTARLLKNGTFTSTTEDADDLGIGSRMVKSLYFWLDACGLVDTPGRRPGFIGLFATGGTNQRATSMTRCDNDFRMNSSKLEPSAHLYKECRIFDYRRPPR